MAMQIGKLSKEQVLKGLQGLTEEERAEVLKAVDGATESTEKTAVDEKPTEAPAQGVEAEKVETTEDTGADAQTETTNGEEQSTVPTEEATGKEETIGEEKPVEESPEAQPQDGDEKLAEENKDEMIKTLTDRVNALEASLKELDDLKSQMQEYADKQAKAFGYSGKVAGGKKSMQDMSASELKQSILSGN